MKRLTALLAGLLFAASLTGCGALFTSLDGSSQESSSQPESSSFSASAEESSEVSSEESSEPEPAVDPYLGAAVPESEAVEKSYFDDAVFVGDSLTYGLGAYEVLDASCVIAHTGINPQTILTSACIEQTNGASVTVLDAVRAAAPHKVYVMLGSNGVAFLTQDNIIEFYGEFLDELRAALPNAILYVESVLPVTHEKEAGDSRYANSKIDALNDALLDLATEKGAYFVNVSEAIKDESGCLPAAASSDGMHFGVSTYNKWVDYLLTHTVDESKLPE